MNESRSCDLQTISDQELDSRLRVFAGEDRRIAAEVVRHLAEVDRRRLFAKWGYPSLFEYVVKELRYSESAAYRRIAAARLTRELPETEVAIREGRLSLSTASQAQSFFLTEKREHKRPYTVAEKRSLLQELEGKSKRETEKILATLSPEVAHADGFRALNGTQVHMQFAADTALVEKLARVRALVAHRLKGSTFNELLHVLSDLVIAYEEERRFKKSSSALPPAEVQIAGVEAQGSPRAETSRLSRYVPVAVRAQVAARDQGRCTYVSPITGRRCASIYALQWEHRLPFALGGPTTAANLTLHCATHNRLNGEAVFGKKVKD